MVPFAGYDMPVQFEGVKAEHLWTRDKAGLFDVSHMGPCFLSLKTGLRPGDETAHRDIAQLVERLVPSDIQNLKPGQARLSVLLNDQGGILDDLIITRPSNTQKNGSLYVVVNGAVKEQDWALLEDKLGDLLTLERADQSHALMALQGPKAEQVLAKAVPEVQDLDFMQACEVSFLGHNMLISRLGYTGEDGFELLCPAEAAVICAEWILSDERVQPIGLGARDSLRLEAGLCLYGQDMDASRTPVEAGLAWTIQKSRRSRADFPGAPQILNQLENGPAARRVGIKPLGRAPAREGVQIFIGDKALGAVTSGGFAPSLGHPIAMGYIASEYGEPGTQIDLDIRGRRHAAEIVALPFIPAQYKRKRKTKA